MIALIKKILKSHPRAYGFAQKAYPMLTTLVALLRGRRGVLDHMRSTWSMTTRSPIVAGRPMNITIEPTNICNLACPVCETGAGVLGREDAHMTYEQFVQIIDQVAPHTNTLMYYFMGEPFLNKQSYRMIRYAKDIGIPWITTCSNGDPVSSEKLVHCGLDEISFQIGGMTQETHQVYRVNSNLERVLRNMRETIRLRNELGIKLRVVCGFILMKHNEHEVSRFRQEMAAMGVDEASVIDPCVRTVEQGHLFLPKDEKHWYYDIESFKKGVLRPKTLPNNECPWIWYSLAILVNGDVVPCCRDPRGEFVMGNLLTQTLAEVWNGERFVGFRKQILSDQGKVSICRLCSSYPVSAIK